MRLRGTAILPGKPAGTPAGAGLEPCAADAFVAELQARAAPDAWPLTVTLDLTEGCNLRCVHCYLGGERRRAGRHMEEGLAADVLERLAEGGVLALVVTGGEPLAHPAFRAWWASARRHGFLLTLFTNATLADPDLAAFLAAHQPRRVEVSVYGFSRAVYESVTGVPGSHARCVGGIRALAQAGVPVRIKYPLLRENAHEAAAAAAWAAAEGLSWRSDATLFPALDGSRRPLSHRVAEAAPPAADRPCTGCEGAVACGAGVRTLHVDVAGNLHPCLLWRDEARPLRQTSPGLWHACMARRRGMELDSPATAGSV